MAGSQRHVNRRRDPQAPHPSECNFSINKRVSGVWRVSRGTAKCNFKPHSRLDAMQRSELLPNPSQASSDAVLDDVSQETLREMAFRKRWTSLMERLQSESASGSEWTIVTAALQGRRFDESAEVLARLVLKGDPDACWVLCADPRDSPVGDPFFRYCVGEVKLTTLLDAAAARAWLEAAASDNVADACVKLAEILWKSDTQASFGYLIKAAAMLELGHGRGGLLEGYTTKVNYCDLCLTIAECYSYNVGTKSDGRKAIEWLEKCWNFKASSTSFLQLLSGAPKNTDQKMAAKILAIWWQTGKPPVVPFHLDRNVFSLVAANASSAFVKSDANKAKLWEGRAAF